MLVTKPYELPKTAVPLEQCYWVIENLLLAGDYPGHPPVPVTVPHFAMRAVAVCSQRQIRRVAPLSARRMEGQRDRQARVVNGLSSRTRRADQPDPPQATIVALHSEIAVDAQLALRAQNDDRFAQGIGSLGRVQQPGEWSVPLRIRLRTHGLPSNEVGRRICSIRTCDGNDEKVGAQGRAGPC